MQRHTVVREREGRGDWERMNESSHDDIRRCKYSEWEEMKSEKDRRVDPPRP